MEAFSPRKKILIIEDERSMLRALVAKFGREGFETLSAADGEAGLHLALTQKPDVILLDIMIPKMDGITVLKELRGDNAGKEIPVLLLTNLSADSHVIQKMVDDIDPSCCLMKADLTIQEVVEKVKAALIAATQGKEK